MGQSKGGSVLPPTTPVTVTMTLTLAEANNLLVALANAINNLGPKNKKGGGGGKTTSGGTSKGSPKGTPKGSPKGPAPKSGKPKG